MKKTFLLYILMTGLTFFSIAQNPEILKIRESYTNYNQLIAKQGDDSQMELPLKIEISYTVTERAIGPFTKHVVMYYDRIELDETNDGAFQYNYFLRKVIVTEKTGYQIYREYFFNRDGQLIFGFFKTDGYWPECSEERFYFKNGELIKVIFAENPDFLGDSVICNSGTRDTGSLTPEDYNAGEEILEQAKKYFAMFISIQ